MEAFDEPSPRPRKITGTEFWQNTIRWVRGLSLISWLIGLMCVVGFGLCFWGVLREMADAWVTFEDYYHCAFVPVLAGWYCWRRRKQLFGVERERCAWGLIPLSVGLAIRWVGALIMVPALSDLALLPVLWGLFWCYWGTRHAKVLLFPVAFLIFMVPIPFPILALVGFPMQGLASTGVYWIGRLIGLPIVREGFVLSVYDFHAQIVQTCSGLHSLFALSMIGTLLAADMRVSLWKKSVLVILILPIVLSVNIFRILLTVMIGTLFGAQLAEGMFHWFSGIILFGTAVISFLYVRHWLRAGLRLRHSLSLEGIPAVDFGLSLPRW